VAQFSPLLLLGQLASLPQNYGQRLPLFYGTSDITTKKHVDKLIDFIDLEEVDEEDGIRIIAQSFFVDVKKWLQSLENNSINSS